MAGYIPSRNTENLTPREQEVLTLVWNGLSSMTIARQLKISYYTVREHRNHIKKKCKAHNVVTTIRVALERKWIKV